MCVHVCSKCDTIIMLHVPVCFHILHHHVINCFFFTEKEERKKVVNAHVDHGTSLSERIKKRKRSYANHKPEDVTDDSASYEGSRGRLCVSFPLTFI
jgi:hypothetical protein